jgi:hypothetical protein
VAGGAVVGGRRGAGDLGRVEVGGPVREGQEAAGREDHAEGGDNPGRVVGIGDEVQDRDEEQADRLREVEDTP